VKNLTPECEVLEMVIESDEKKLQEKNQAVQRRINVWKEILHLRIEYAETNSIHNRRTLSFVTENY
jgi:hypothetical protein